MTKNRNQKIINYIYAKCNHIDHCIECPLDPICSIKGYVYTLPLIVEFMKDYKEDETWQHGK